MDIPEEKRKFSAVVGTDVGDRLCVTDGQADREIMENFQVVLETLGYFTGFIEGLSSIAGISRKDLDTSLRTSFGEGRLAALDLHSRHCSGCDADAELRREMARVS